MATQVEATKKIIAGLQSVLFEADNQLDIIAVDNPPSVCYTDTESICRGILRFYKEVEPTQEDVDKLKAMLTSTLTTEFGVDSTRF